MIDIRSIFSAAILSILVIDNTVGEQCYSFRPNIIMPTRDYWVEADEQSGAKGDMVGVTITLHCKFSLPSARGLELAVCHDPEIAEIVGEPVYSEELLEMLSVGGVWFMEVSKEAGFSYNTMGTGAYFGIFLDETAFNARFPSDDPLPLLTLFYRIIGEPGEFSKLTFCEGILERKNPQHSSICVFNRLFGEVKPFIGAESYVSQVNKEGLMTVIEGPPTRTELPPIPQKAKIYPELRSPEDIQFQVRLSGGIARPGDKDVPVEVFIKANVEYAAVQIPIDFDERYLRLQRAEDHFLFGTVLVNNQNEDAGGGPEEGNAVIVRGLPSSKRRIAAEGEEFHAATLYFEVLPAASEISNTDLLVSEVLGGDNHLPFRPWIGVWTSDANFTGGSAQVQVAIEPISIIHGNLALRQSLNALLGDANLDGALDTSDAVSILSYLFLGAPELLCPKAADFDRNGVLEITDPIAFLGAYFLGEPPMESKEVPCRE